MDLIPGIDIYHGQCVKLSQGKPAEPLVYSDDPCAMAGQWVSRGAEHLQLVDLNGALQGTPVHTEIISRICHEHPGISVQVGGGIRDIAAIEACLNAGATRVIIGTQALQAPEFIGEACSRFPSHILVSLDGLHGQLAVKGRSEITDVSVRALAMLFEYDSIEGFVFTDIGKDGMLGGPAFGMIKNLSENLSKAVLVAGGVANLSDIEDLLELGRKLAGGVTAVVVRRALYEGGLDLEEALALCKSSS